MIIGLTGPSAAGKGTIVKYLVEKYHAKQIRFSDPLRDIIHRLYQQETRENMSHLATFLRGEFGGDILISTLLKDIEKLEAPIFVLDGMRHLDEYHVLSRRDDFAMWSVDANIRVRYERIIQRGENLNETKLTFEQFEEQHKLKTEEHIPELIEKAYEHIDNNGTVEEMYAQVDAIMKTQ